MKAGLVIDIIQEIRNTAAKKKLYQLFLNLKNIQEELQKKYSDDDEVDVNQFTILLQTCLIGLPDDQRLLLTPIIRELKLSQLL
jgi:hypothetical protein